MSNMPKLTLVLSAALIALGAALWIIYSWLDGEPASWTAMIPAIPGVLFGLLGALAVAKPGWRMHVMHVAALLSLLVALAGFGMGVPRLIAWLGDEPSRPRAILSMLLMGVFALAFLVACVRSFINARRQREAAAA